MLQNNCWTVLKFVAFKKKCNSSGCGKWNLTSGLGYFYKISQIMKFRKKIEAQRFGLLITPRCEGTSWPPIGYPIFGRSTLENGDFLYFYISFDTNVSQRDKEHPKIAKKKRVKNRNFDQIDHSYFWVPPQTGGWYGENPGFQWKALLYTYIVMGLQRYRTNVNTCPDNGIALDILPDTFYVLSLYCTWPFDMAITHYKSGACVYGGAG